MFKTLTSAIDPKKNPTSEEINKIPSYIFCKWLAGNPHSISAANMINLYDDIPMENQYLMIKHAFAGKIKYIPYPKSETEKELKQTEFVAKHFNISLEKAKEYIELIDKNELKHIVDAYTEYELKK
jgi:hypothetical protein